MAKSKSGRAKTSGVRARAKSSARAKARKRKTTTRSKPAKAVSQRWVITASGDRKIGDVAKDLAAAGLKGGAVLGAIGSITGSAPRSAVAKLRKVRGVADVSADAPIDVGPPDAPETW